VKIERPWAAQGDYYEVMVPDEGDWAALRECVSEPSPEERTEAAQRYLMARYGGILPFPSTGTRCPGCGTPDDVPMDSAPLPETDDEARSFCTTCGRRMD
jgi:hypothetical protein